MDSLKKLKIAVIILLILMIISLISSFMIVSMEESQIIDIYDDLSYDDQQVINKWVDALPDYIGFYTILGFIQYAMALGLFLLVIKLLPLKKLP